MQKLTQSFLLSEQLFMTSTMLVVNQHGPATVASTVALQMAASLFGQHNAIAKSTLAIYNFAFVCLAENIFFEASRKCRYKRAPDIVHVPLSVIMPDHSFGSPSP